MSFIATILIGLIALPHFYILWLEMFAWESRGPRVFGGFSKDMFAKTKSMAANQGLYNGFLAAGLVWSLFIGDGVWAQNVAVFFLLCVAVAGGLGRNDRFPAHSFRTNRAGRAGAIVSLLDVG